MKKTLYTIIAFISLLLGAEKNYAQGPCEPRLQTDSAEILFDRGVAKMVMKDHYLYAGGSFTTVGKFSGSFIELNKQSGAAVNRRAWPKVAGHTAGAIADGNGSHIVFGDFRSIGDIPRSKVGVIDKNGNLTSFSVTIDSAVSCAVLVNGILYIGGYFTKVNGQPRNKLAAIDMSTGNLLPWDPDVKNTGPLRCRIECMTINNGVLHVGGAFSHVGSTARKNIAAVSIATGGATNWAPEAYYSTASSYGNVANMLKVGDVLYICGGFDQAGGGVHVEVAAIDINSGVASSWNPNPNSVVLSLANKGDTLYLGGAFFQISGQPRQSFAAYSISTGNLLPLTINTKQKILDKVYAIMPIGDTLYLGGEFDTTNNQLRKNIASFNRNTGGVLPFKSHTSHTVRSLLYEGSKLYAGGDFVSVDRKVRKYLAALDMDADTITDWYPQVNDEVTGLRIMNDVMYIMGSFTKLNDSLRPYSGALNTKTWAVTKWNPRTNLGVSGIGIKDVVRYNDAIYIAGHFTTVGGQPRNGLAKTDTLGNVQSWIGTTGTGFVNVLQIWKDSLYVGGVFSELGGQPRANFGSFNLKTGTTALANIEKRPDSFVEINAICLFNDTLYIGAIFNATEPPSHPSGRPTYLIVPVMAGYELNKNSLIPWGIPTPYYQPPRFSLPINDIVVSDDRKIYVAGNYTWISKTPLENSFHVQKGLCIFNVPPSPPNPIPKYFVPIKTAFDPKIQLGPVTSIAFYGNKQYFAGNFGDDSAGTFNAMMFYAPYILLSADIVADTNEMCDGIKSTVLAKSTVIYGAKYMWKVNGINVNNAKSHYTFTPSNKDSVICIVSVDNNGCTADWYDTTNSVIYKILPNIIPDITISGPVEEEVGKTVVIKAVVKTADTGYTIEWFNKGISMGKTKTDSISYSKGTGKDSIYAVITPRTDTCYVTDTSSLIVVGEKEDESSIRIANGGDGRVIIYPNPFDTYVKVKGVEQGDVLLLYDVMGRKISSVMISNGTEYLLSTSAVKSGTYVLKLTNKEGLNRKTILLQKQ